MSSDSPAQSVRPVKLEATAEPNVFTLRAGGTAIGLSQFLQALSDHLAISNVKSDTSLSFGIEMDGLRPKARAVLQITFDDADGAAQLFQGLVE